MFSGGRTDGRAGRRLPLRPRLFWPLAGLALFAGCRSHQNSSLVEAELRTREREIRAMRDDLARCQTFNDALVRELHERTVCPPAGIVPAPGVTEIPPTLMAGLIKQVTLGRGTAGIDDDGLPGDEALQVVVVPQDYDGSAIKAPGNLVVQAFEVTAEGAKVPLSRWDVPALQLQRLWRSGLFTTGYFVALPWKTWPSSEKLRVVVQFTTLPDNRPFEAERDVTIKLPPGGRPRAVPTSEAPLQPRLPDCPLEGPLVVPGFSSRDRPAATLEAAKPAPARLLPPD
jgi:hypothetical protein